MALQILMVGADAPALVAMHALLETEGFRVVGRTEDRRQAVELAEALRPHVVVLDLGAQPADGIETLRDLTRRSPEVSVVVTCANNSSELVTAAFRSGARAYVAGGEGSGDLLRAVELVSRGGMFLSPDACRYVIRPYLPPREAPADED